MLKRIKRLLRKRVNAGFTLVEVVISCALLGVLMLGMFGFINPVMENIRQKEQNARAVMLCETIESYIVNSTKYAYYVNTFTNVTPSDVTASSSTTKPYITDLKYTGTEFPEHASAEAKLADMITCMETVLNTDSYEIRCIGMRWMLDKKSGYKKMMLTNEVVNQKTGALDLSKTKLVFETCFYDELFPILEYKNYDNQYKVLDNTGAAVDKYADADIKMATGLEVTVNVHLEPDCYNVKQVNRNSSLPTFVGTTFADYRSISGLGNSSGSYKVCPNLEVNTYDAAKAKNPAGIHSYEGEQYYYPDTYIYFLARKTKVTTPATPAP